jgi:mRNA interferase MazF
MSPRPGEVYVIDFGIVAKVRPAVVVSREDPESPRAICSVVPITTQNRGSCYEVLLGRPNFLREPVSWVNTQAIASVGHEKLLKKVGQVSLAQLNAIKQALRFALEL